MDVPLAQCPAFDSDIFVYHSMTAIFYSPSDTSGLWGTHQECIQSTPCWHKHLPRCDTVFITHDSTLTRIQCFDIMQILVLFSFIHENVFYPCALVRWFIYIADEPDEAMGMWVVQPDQNANGSPAIGVIHMDSVLCAAHLMPVFGDALMLIELHTENSLNAFQVFYINKYIDYHAFKITSL